MSCYDELHTLHTYIPARWVDVVATGVVRVDGAVKVIVVGSVERVLVEAALLRHAVGVVQILRVAQKVLHVPLVKSRAEQRRAEQSRRVTQAIGG